MTYDVVVVGAGIGGLTVAALLAKRGMSVCIFERQSQVGGCIGRVEFGGLDFEPGMGIYSGWGNGEIYEQLFSELATEAPKASAIKTDYVVRFENQDIGLKRDANEFFAELRRAFPETAEAAVEFYKQVIQTTELRLEQSKSGFATSLRRLRKKTDTQNASQQQTAFSAASQTSTRFQDFIHAQLRAFLHSSIHRCAWTSASRALSFPRQPLYSIEGGISTLAERLADSIKSAGGTVRLNQPVLRLAYNERGEPTGVDLLNGETVSAKRAIVSNLTVWDTSGKLIGLNRTPPEIKSSLARLQAKGAYVIYAAIDASTRERLPARNFLIETSESDEENNLSSDLTVSIREPQSNGMCAATIKASTEVAPWFSFQTSEADYEAWDQSALEVVWSRLHHAVPEFGSGIEVIETANPRTYYDQTRRKLGMVMGVESTQDQDSLKLPFTNVFIVGDTVSGATLEDVVRSSIQLAHALTKMRTTWTRQSIIV
jgi:phytoene dehydrogenase-like protein